MKAWLKKNKAFIAAFCVLLAVLFVLSTTDLVFKERKNKIYHISIIVPDSDLAKWENYRSGVNDAAAYYNADISFVTLYNGGDSAEQLEAVSREVQNGAEAVIICAADGEYISQNINDVRGGVPIVALGGDIDSKGVKARVLYDYAEIGKLIAAEVKSDLTEQRIEKQVIISVQSGENASAADTVTAGFVSALGVSAEPSRRTVQGEQTADELVKSLSDENEYILLAADLKSFELLAKAMRENGLPNGIRLYGTGLSDEIKTYIETGVVKAAACMQEYPAGYKSIEFAVGLVDGTLKEQLYEPQAFTVTQDNMFDAETEKNAFLIS